MKNILKVVFVIIGTLIGAGFASGQEMYIFFFKYGFNGILGLLVSSTLIGIITYKTLKIVNKYDILDYKDFIEVIIGKNYNYSFFNIKNIFNIVINIFILITFFIMVAGFGAYFEQALGINHTIGSSILALLCFIVFQMSTEGLVKVSEFIIPVLILLIGLIGVLSFSKVDISNTINTLLAENTSGWLIKSILYCSYNSIILIPTLITLKKYIRNKKDIFLISIITIIIVILLSIILFFILTMADINISTVEMPVVYIVEKVYTGFIFAYGFVIISSIFTTSISLGNSFLNNVAKNKKSYTHIAQIMCITAVIISNFGFSNLVNLLYPIFGYLGLMQIFAMFCKQYIEK